MQMHDHETVSIAFDISGCPNRCRHCWLGCAGNTQMDLNEVINSFDEARQAANAIDGSPAIAHFASWFREPHYHERYRDLRELELQLNNGADPFPSFELLSTWRLARDPSYAPWARSIGYRKCQITLFGAGPETNDWGYRRKGAHEDILAATEALLRTGIVPRWQVFQTRRVLPELDDLMRLVDGSRLRERASELGAEFVVFLHDPTPTGEARSLEEHRLTASDVESIPGELRQSTEQHFGESVEYTTEGEWLESILGEEDEGYAPRQAGDLWLFVTSDWDVYPNFESLERWWRLGNAKRDGLALILNRLVQGAWPASGLAESVSVHDLARRYGDPGSERVYLSRDDLVARWFEEYCESATDAPPE